MMNQEQLQKATEMARYAAAQAAGLIRSYYMNRDNITEVKSDNSPVTIADKEAEKTIIRIIKEAYPDHDIFGEEYGRDGENSDYLWLIDPIDGTKSFVRGYPFFSTQIALMFKGELVLGVSHAPLMDEQAYAYKNGGAYLNGEPLKVQQQWSEHSSCVSTGNIQSLVHNNWHKLGQLLLKFSKIRGYGDFYHYHLLAGGKIDLLIESDVNILDIAALTVIVREAGGLITDLNGHNIGLDTTDVVAGNQQTHALAMDYLS
ncbi:inositol monophosphatase family protein [Marinicella gelatinilytica]|uniref:inositol monophosphatase family protein n=1 Tax=Marinicella gelatinilytica TaxID=2996017 RepID=UPI002260A067|nr:inositol monophosphatase [Marinicella gelatinilytica]MCX7543832.1 inositol monophosphatase [Marinicella gelatinilytica]